MSHCISRFVNRFKKFLLDHFIDTPEELRRIYKTDVIDCYDPGYDPEGDK